MKKQEHLTVVGYLKESYYALVDENKKLKEENKELKQEMERIGKEARKLAFLVDKLREAIEEEKN